MSGMASAQKVVVIVDPYSSGRYLLAELQEQNWPMVGVQSSQDLAPMWLEQYDPSLFVATVRHESLEQTLQELSAFHVHAVLAGSEPGVFLTEDLQDALGLPNNGSDTKMWRRNKWDMHERLHEVGVRAIHQCSATSVREMLEWQAQWGRWPIIVKPPMAGGTDGVYWCHDAADVEMAFEAEFGRVNINGESNNVLLAQEYLDGEEYIIDMVSHEGRHVLNGIWKYGKEKEQATKSVVCMNCQVLDSRGALQDILIEYTMQVLDALDVKFGPSHNEVMMVAGEPCLVEVNSRMHGLKGPMLTGLATGLGIHELTVDAMVNGARLFNELHAANYRYHQKKFVRCLNLRNRGAGGILTKSLEVPEILELPSCQTMFPSVTPGKQLQVTRDLSTSPGLVILVHPVAQQLELDDAAIRALEASGELYHVEDPLLSVPASPKSLSPKLCRAFSKLNTQHSLMMESEYMDSKVRLAEVEMSPMSPMSAMSPVSVRFAKFNTHYSLLMESMESESHVPMFQFVEAEESPVSTDASATPEDPSPCQEEVGADAVVVVA